MIKDMKFKDAVRKYRKVTNGDGTYYERLDAIRPGKPNPWVRHGTRYEWICDLAEQENFDEYEEED